ncbi:hypothetical protein HS041_33070 [Planomonospora sp. ID67723]|uniref:hypothetical protein n=1 Tax=Planomonospora sp. ID67723 TaxID=2738134 RepID=UPI0018C3B549|nr:hypothetical protein [Planomonospora sp. ID67723]MBG0832537.1 hypothetical protein [Planomonospora sp. ID67723]
MSLRSSVTPVVASGTASAVKLLVAALAFTGAYVGVEASQNASGQARASAVADSQVQTVTLSAEAMPVTTAKTPESGVITVSAVASPRPCEKPYRAQSVIDNADPDGTVSYGWRLERWSPAAKKWRTYLTSHSGFTGGAQSVEWQPRIVNNPGWYRVKLSVSGGDVLNSEKFQVSC